MPKPLLDTGSGRIGQICARFQRSIIRLMTKPVNCLACRYFEAAFGERHAVDREIAQVAPQDL
jgi:hypothetical protein